MSYARNKGTAFETAVVKYLQSCGFTTPRRIALSGAAGDKGDVWLGDNPVCPDVVIECKNYAKELPYKMVEDFVDEAWTEYCHALKTDSPNNYRALLVVKRVNLGVADSWLIWKNKYNITLRARLGDVINQQVLSHCNTEQERIDCLVTRLKGGNLVLNYTKQTTLMK